MGSPKIFNFWGERRQLSPNDAKRHSLRLACRTRLQNYYFFPTLASTFWCLHQFFILSKSQSLEYQLLVVPCFYCLHQFIFWSCQKKAVPLQRISKIKIYVYEKCIASICILVFLVYEFTFYVYLLFTS